MKNLIIVACIFLASCAVQKESVQNAMDYTLVTDQLIKENSLSYTKLRKIQFYNGAEVILERAMSESSSDIVLGKLIIRESKRFDRVILKMHTEGVLLGGDSNSRILKISFEQDDSKYFSFMSVDGSYVLAIKEERDGKSLIQYGVNMYQVFNPEQVELYLNAEKLNSDSPNERVIGGRSVLTGQNKSRT